MTYRVGLDIGTKNIRAAIVEEQRDGTRRIASLITLPSSGVKRGAIDQPAAATQALSPAIAQVRNLARTAVKHITASVAGVDLKIQQTKGVVAVSRADNEIFEDDITRVLQSARAINLPPNRVIIDTIIREFIVDGITGIADPLGMIGKRLEASLLILDSFTPTTKNMERCLETLGAHVEHFSAGPVAAAHATLTPSQKELGSLLIDIGAGTTKIAIFEENRLSHVAVIPVGGANITNDLAIGLRIPIEVAETVKLSYGSALAKEVSARDAIELSKIDPRARGTITKKFIAEIIEDRLAEIFELVNNEVKRIGKISQLPAGVVLVGGTAKMPAITELARQELKLSAQIGVPDLSKFTTADAELHTRAEDPEFATAIGLLINPVESSELVRPSESAANLAKKILHYFIP